MKPVVGFVGMTHLGLNSAAASAAHGFETVCVDFDTQVVAGLNRGELPIVEPELPDLLANNRQLITFTNKAVDLKTCQVIYIASDVATNDQGESDLKTISQLIESVMPVIADEAILVVLCQVPPGFTRSLSFPKNRLLYQVETLIFGRAVERAMHPERFIIGCLDPQLPLPLMYQKYLDAFSCPILPMRYESAELAKISINCCLVAMVSVANTLSEVCERIGADWREIVPALKLDKRIGPDAYLNPGLGIAGGNLERDLTTICHLSVEHGTDSGVVRAWVANSGYRRDWVLRTLHAKVLSIRPDSRIAILGLAYKENTHSIKNSPSVALISYLSSYTITVFDPVVSSSEVSQTNLTGASSALEAVKGADVLVIMTPWPEFKQLTPVDLTKVMQNKIIIDPYRVLEVDAFLASGFEYFSLGMVPHISV